MTAITKAYYNQLVSEARTLGVAEQPYVLASLLSVSGGGTGSATLADILSALTAFDVSSVKYLNYRITNLGETGSESIQLAGELNTMYSLSNATIYNPNAYPVFIKLYEAETVVIGTTPVVYTIMIPALGQIVLDSNTFYSNLIDFFNISVTKLYADDDTTPIDTPLIAQIKICVNAY